MTKIEYLTKVLENVNGDIGSLVDNAFGCGFCPLRMECRKAAEDGNELPCGEWLNKVLTD